MHTAKGFYWSTSDSAASQPTPPYQTKSRPLDLLYPLRSRITALKIDDRRTAHLLCKLIPAQCPFARNIAIRGITVLRIPPLCKLNPLYAELVDLRYRALCYLADQCGEDIGEYC